MNIKTTSKSNWITTIQLIDENGAVVFEVPYLNGSAYDDPAFPVDHTGHQLYALRWTSEQYGGRVYSEATAHEKILNHIGTRKIDVSNFAEFFPHVDEAAFRARHTKTKEILRS